MARVLLLLPTKTYRTHDFLKAAHDLGVDVTVASEEASTLASLNPAELLQLSFGDPQEAGRQAVEFHAQHPVDAVVPVDDQVTPAAAAICQALSLKYNPPEAILAARDKHRMREHLRNANVPSPQHRLCNLEVSPADLADLASAVRYPCVVKPLTLSGSRGVMRANDECEFTRAVKRLRRILAAPENQEGDPLSSPGSRFLVEDFVPGKEVALEGLLSGGKLRLLALFDKPDPLDGPFFEETIFITPSRLPGPVQEEIIGTTDRAVAALGLKEGPVHVELRVKDEAVWIIEVNPRSIGGLCSRVLRFGVGMSLEELIIRQALGQDTAAIERQGRPAGVMMIPVPRAGILEEVRGVAAAEAVVGVEKVTISAHPGQELVPLPEGSPYPGFIFAHGPTPEIVETALREAHGHLEFIIRSP